MNPNRNNTPEAWPSAPVYATHKRENLDECGDPCQGVP
jgi:hypothetical protein